MKVIPVWYKVMLACWVFIVAPFHFFMTDFNGIPFLSLPDEPGPNGSPLWLFIGYMIALFAPLWGGILMLVTKATGR